MEQIPADFPVQPIDPDDPTAKLPVICGTCGLAWDDGVITSMTPAPSARCPFEQFHVYKDGALTDDARTFLSDSLAASCGYDPEGDTGVDSLIDYKDALEDELDRIEGIVRASLGVTLNQWLMDMERYGHVAAWRRTEESS